MKDKEMEKLFITLKKIVVVAVFAIIIYFAVVFALSMSAILITSVIIGLSIYGAYELWFNYARPELMKKEENFDVLKNEESDDKG